MTDLIAVHRSVLETSIAVVDHVTTDDLGRPTPCTGWRLRDLLAHMIGQNYGFAAAAEGAGQDASVFADRSVGGEPAAEYAASAARVIEAFATPGLLDTEVYLAEVRGGASFSARVAVSFHLVDYVAHGWDVARTLGSTPDFDDAALQVALGVATAVPAEAKSDDKSAPFGPAVATGSASVLDRVIASLGRSPDWAPAG